MQRPSMYTHKIRKANILRIIMQIRIPNWLTTLVISTVLVSMTLPITIDAIGQTGNMATLQNIGATYAISIIPGAAQRESVNHYYPPAVAVPTDTTIAWFNNDFGQPHTVTSGSPNTQDIGTVFNSGVIPATANSFFQYTFDKSGEFAYHCIIHPWRAAVVSVSDAIERGNNFELSSGTGPVWDFNKDFRTLLSIEPLTIPLDRTTPLTYNITISRDDNSTEGDTGSNVFSDTYVVGGEALALELVRGIGNETISHGPDFSSTGAYHIEGPFFTGNSNYTIRAQITSIDAQPPENPIVDEFGLRTVA
jgi:plastocyanin